MNNTKWDEIRLAMHGLGPASTSWRTRDRTSGHVSEWDRDWYDHFRSGGYETSEWLDIATAGSVQREAGRIALRKIHLPGEQTEAGFRIYGFSEPGWVARYL